MILVGHDWGSSLAWHIASNAPERVLQLAVLSVGHPLSFFPAGGNAQRRRSWYCMFFNHPEAEELLTANNWQLWRKILEVEDPKMVERSIVDMSKPGALTAGKRISLSACCRIGSHTEVMHSDCWLFWQD